MGRQGSFSRGGRAGAGHTFGTGIPGSGRPSRSEGAEQMKIELERLRARSHVAVALLLLVFCAACATAYQPMAFKGGYREAKLADDTYMVTFLANAFTAPDTANIYLVYRCAELTAEKGYDYFVPLS